MSSLKKNFIYNSIYQILQILIPIITTPYLARALGAEKIGFFSYENAIAYYFGMFVLLGINNYGNRTIATQSQDKDKCDKTFWEVYCMQFIMGLLVLFSFVLFCWCSGANIIRWFMLIYIISVIVDINWYFWGIEFFKFTAIRSIIVKIVSTILIFVVVKNENDIYLYVLIILLSSFVNNFILWVYVLKNVTFNIPSKKNVIKHIKSNLILFVPIIAVSLYKYMDKIMLGLMVSKKQVGYYEYSEKITMVPLSLVNSLGIVMLPKMSNLVANKQNESESKIMDISLALAMFMVTSISFGLMGIAKQFVPLFYGSGYDECISLFYILLPSCCFVAFANVIRTQYLIPHKYDSIYVKSVLYGAIVNLLINIVLIPSLQAFGAALGTLTAESVVCIYQLLKVKNELPIISYIKEAICYVMNGIIMFLVLNFISLKVENYFITMIVKVIIGIACYFIGLQVMLVVRKNGITYSYFQKLMKVKKT